MTCSFAIIIQMARVTKEYCLQLIGCFEPSEENQRLLQMGIDGKLNVNIDNSIVLRLSEGYCWRTVC